MYVIYNEMHICSLDGRPSERPVEVRLVSNLFETIAQREAAGLNAAHEWHRERRSVLLIAGVLILNGHAPLERLG